MTAVLTKAQDQFIAVWGQMAGAWGISRTMAVGGSAMHWQGHANRFSAEDLRLESMYGLATDWPLSWSELEPFLADAERRIGVAGEPSPPPEDARSAPRAQKKG